MTKTDDLERAIKTIPKEKKLPKIKQQTKKEETDMKNIKCNKIFTTIKDITLIALIASLVGLVGGIKYQEAKTSDIKTQAGEIVSQLKVQR